MSAELMNNNKKYVLEETNSSKNNSKQNMTLKIQNESINYIPFTKKWRVKLYILNENGQWDDKGIGHVFCANETEQQNNLSEGKQNSSKLVKKLIMLKEKTNEIIFNIDIINENIDFHNQRGTILTWKKGGTYGQDNNAISFQEKEGVLEILKNIQIINGKNVPED
jgi:protein phosphatase-4 regulatory subunit 3